MVSIDVCSEIEIYSIILTSTMLRWMLLLLLEELVVDFYLLGRIIPSHRHAEDNDALLA